MDVGCYCVSFSRLIAREEPSEIHGVAKIGERSRVDEFATGLLKFPSGIVASFTCALRCKIPITAIIYGSKGSISINTPWLPSDENATITIVADGKEKVVEAKYGRNLYANEALTVAEYLDQRQAPAMSWDDSLGQMRTLDALRAEIGLVFDCEK